VNLIKNAYNPEDDFKDSTVFFPLVGLLIGGLLAMAARAGSIFLQKPSTVLLVIVLEIVITGGLHHDGLMDSCDGLLSGCGREKMLEIMKDSRVGSMGVLGLVVHILIRVLLLLELPANLYVQVLLVMPMLGRWAMACAISLFPYAKQEGLGKLFHGYSGKINLFWASLYTLIFSIVILPAKLYLALPLTLFCVYLAAKKINNALKGLTGDTYGLINEMTGSFFLFWSVFSGRF
jgi:adenosylcobinamide-GDP ribazoletransferase